MLDYKELEKRILLLNEVYYNTGNSEITDAEYDALKAELKKLNPHSVVFNVVGAEVTVPLVKQFQHVNPMLSLENVFNTEDLIKFFERAGISPNTFINIEDKLDGLACSLHYEDGKLDIAATRGNGTIGEIITEPVSYMATVPKYVDHPLFKGKVEVRGEIIMPREYFDLFNETSAAMGNKTFISPRNAAVGSINSKNPRTAAARGCVFRAYGLYGADTGTHNTDMDLLGSIGFQRVFPNPVRLIELERWIPAAAQRLNERSKHGIDGIVFKIDDKSIQNQLGMNNTAPRWAVAFKQNVEVAETVVETVDWQVGRMGAITPVARLKPVILSDALISNVTLHNWSHIQTLGLGLGDRILIVRSGGVIPKVNLVLDKAKPPVDILKPVNCPSCNSIIKANEGVLSCSNLANCKDVQVERLIFACSKEALDIKGIGPEVVRHAFETGQISTIADLFKPKAAIAFASRFPATAEQTIPKYQMLIKDACKASRTAAIISLCIPTISTVTANQFAKSIDRLPELLTLDQPTLVKMGITPVRIQNFLEYIRVPANINLVNELDLLLEFEPIYSRQDTLNGLSFVVTGSFEQLSRKELETFIMNNGGKVVGKVSTKTDYLVVGEGGGGKKEEADKLNVPTLHEDEFIKLMKSKGLSVL